MNMLSNHQTNCVNQNNERIDLIKYITDSHLNYLKQIQHHSQNNFRKTEIDLPEPTI